jgi:hypothetical protein
MRLTKLMKRGEGVGARECVREDVVVGGDPRKLEHTLKGNG